MSDQFTAYHVLRQEGELQVDHGDLVGIVVQGKQVVPRVQANPEDHVVKVDAVEGIKKMTAIKLKRKLLETA